MSFVLISVRVDYLQTDWLSFLCFRSCLTTGLVIFYDFLFMLYRNEQNDDGDDEGDDEGEDVSVQMSWLVPRRIDIHM